MAAKKLYRVLAVTLLTLALVVSVFPICAFAADFAIVTETSGAVDAEGNDVTVAPETEGVDVAVAAGTDETVSDTAAREETVAETAEVTGTETAAETGTDTGAETEAATDEKSSSGISTGTIISIAIVLVIIVIAAVYCVKNKEKVAKFFREVKSELKKIVWTPWSQVKKNTLVVVVVVLACAAVGALFDFLFSKGIISLGNLF